MWSESGFARAVESTSLLTTDIPLSSTGTSFPSGRPAMEISDCRRLAFPFSGVVKVEIGSIRLREFEPFSLVLLPVFAFRSGGRLHRVASRHDRLDHSEDAGVSELPIGLRKA